MPKKKKERELPEVKKERMRLSLEHCNTVKDAKLTPLRDAKKLVFIDTMREKLGLIAHACREAGICKTTYKNWYDADEDFKREVDAIKEATGDMVENKLFENIRENDTTAIIFYCKTKLKDRGYIEPQHKINQTININPNEKIKEEDLEIIEEIESRRMKDVTKTIEQNE